LQLYKKAPAAIQEERQAEYQVLQRLVQACQTYGLGAKPNNKDASATTTSLEAQAKAFYQQLCDVRTLFE
jgi:isopenicillin N synthase-like dioxygenase